METSTKVFIGLGIVVAIGAGVFIYTKRSDSASINAKEKEPSIVPDKSAADKKSAGVIDKSKVAQKVITQAEADKIYSEVLDFVKKQNEQFGSMTQYSTGIKNNMLQPLWDGGYKIENNKPVKK